MDESDERVIAKDQAEHPGCVYSRSYTKSCRFESSKGGMVCDSLKRVLRQCPGERPVPVIDSRTSGPAQDAAGAGLFDILRDFGGLGGGGGGGGGGASGSNSAAGADESTDPWRREVDALMGAFGGKPSVHNNKQPVKPKQRPWSIKDFDKYVGGEDDDGVERA